MRHVSSSVLLCLVLSAGACAGGNAEMIMKTGPLPQVMSFDTPNATIGVRYVKAGARWTNVWIDVIVGAKGQDIGFDPNDFELFDTNTKITYKPSLRTFMSVNGLYGPMMGGGRSDHLGLGLQQGSQAAPLRAGTNVPITLVFETQPGEVKGITSVDLVYRGQHLALRAQ
jgi:hypothetical protein